MTHPKLTGSLTLTGAVAAAGRGDSNNSELRNGGA